MGNQQGKYLARRPATVSLPYPRFTAAIVTNTGGIAMDDRRIGRWIRAAWIALPLVMSIEYLLRERLPETLVLREDSG
jgi:hypothetical protein